MLMRFRKPLAITLTLLVVIAICATGCSKPAEPVQPENGQEEGVSYDGVFLKITTSAAGGGWYPFAGAMSVIWQKFLPGLTATAQTSSGIAENMELLKSGNAEIGFMNPDVVYQNFNKLGAFADQEPYEDLRMLFNVTGGPFHTMTLEGNGIHSIEDFRGKRIGIGPNPTSAVNAAVLALLYAYDIPESEVTLVPYARDDRAEALGDGQIDAAVFQIHTGAPTIMDLITVQDAIFLDLDETAKQKILDKYPYYTDYPVPGAAYQLDKDVESFGVVTFLGVDKSMDEQLAYDLTKIYFEYLDLIGEIYPQAKDLSIDNAVQTKFVKLHPGAERYLREQGVVE